VVSTQMEVCFAFFLPNAMIPVYGHNKIHSRCFGQLYPRTASLGFRSVTGAVNTIGGYEAMHMIRKGHQSNPGYRRVAGAENQRPIL